MYYHWIDRTRASCSSRTEGDSLLIPLRLSTKHRSHLVYLGGKTPKRFSVHPHRSRFATRPGRWGHQISDGGAWRRLGPRAAICLGGAWCFAENGDVWAVCSFEHGK